MMCQRKRQLVSILIFVLLLFPLRAWAQTEDETITLKVRKTFGYGLGNQIQGRFSLRVDGPENLERVEFMIDDAVINVDSEAPFQYDFSTGDYPEGTHIISAKGYTLDGRSLRSEAGTYVFLSSEDANTGVVKILLPMFGIIFGIMLLVGLGSAFMGRRKGGFRLGEYGLAGGAICPRCGMPFSRHVLSPNLLIGKIERCPHCKSFVIVRSASPLKLQEAEARLKVDLQQGQFEAEEDEDQRLKRLLDESRFEE
jgi:hypothetical protein